MLFFCFFGGLGIVFDEPGKIFRIVDLVAEHLLAASGEEGLTLARWHSYEAFDGGIKLLYSTRLSGAIGAADGAVVGKRCGMDAIAQLVGIFQFAQVANASHKVVESDERCTMLACIFFLLKNKEYKLKKIQADGRQ